MTRQEKAKTLFLEGYNCSQAVLGAFCDVMDMDFETAMKGYKTKNPQFAEAKQQVITKQNSSPLMNGQNQEPQNNNQFMNSLIRGEQQ